MTAILLLTPLLLCILIFLRKSIVFGGWCNVCYALILFAGSLYLYAKPGGFTSYFRTDEISILFLLILSVLYLGISLYNTEYIGHKKTRMTPMFFIR